MQKLSRPYLVSLQPVHQRDTHNTTGNTCADRQINVHLATVSNHRPILFTPPTSLHSLCFAHFTHILNYPLHPLTQPPIHSTYSLNHSTHSPIPSPLLLLSIPSQLLLLSLPSQLYYSIPSPLSPSSPSFLFSFPSPSNASCPLFFPPPSPYLHLLSVSTRRLLPLSFVP